MTGLDATGGSESIVELNGIEYKVHAFTNTGTSTFDVGGSGKVDVLVVGGGGGGCAYSQGAAGGAGGLAYVERMEVSGSNEIQVGSGAPASGDGNTAADQGEDSFFDKGGSDEIQAIGGGGGAGNFNSGGTYQYTSQSQYSGGSGGGAAQETSLEEHRSTAEQPGTNNPSTGFLVYDAGNAGGISNTTANTNDLGNGAGGAGQQGNPDNTTQTNDGGTAGGDGINMSSIFGRDYGSFGWFSGGGATGSESGGIGGGGDDSVDGSSNTGGGGGRNAAGGSGAVLVRYEVNTPAPSKGLISHWAMNNEDRSGGTMYDSSAYDNHGSINNNPNNTSGIVGDALQFTDGNSEWIDGSSTLNYDNELSVTAWIKPDVGAIDTSSSPTRRGVVDDDVFEIDQKVNENISIILNNDSVGDVNKATYEYPDGQWSLVTLVFDGTNLRMYRDTELLDSTTATGGSPSNPPRIATNYNDDSRMWQGDIADVRIYDRPLSYSEIERLYNMRE